MSLGCYTFEDGARVGDHILSLISAIEPRLKSSCSTFLSEEELQPFYDQISCRSKRRQRLAWVEGLLSKLLKPKELDSGLITLWGADEFWENQQNYAPICEIPPDLGFIQFGSWDGNSSGDAWIIDTEYDRIAALSISMLEYDADTVRSSCYALFESPWQWLSHLRCTTWEREWTLPRFTD